MLWVISLPANYGSPQGTPSAGGKRGWTFFPWGRVAVAPKLPLGERPRDGERSTLSWGTTASPSQRFTWYWQQGGLSYGCSPHGRHSLHGHCARVWIYTLARCSLRSLWAAARRRREGALRGRGGEAGAESRPPPTLPPLGYFSLVNPLH